MIELISKPAVSKADIERLEGAMLAGDCVDIEVSHTFAPGIYVRTAHFKRGQAAIGHEHLTENVCIVSSGHFSVLQDGEVKEILAPAIFVSPPGVRRVAIFHEDTTFSNIHPNPDNERSFEKLEERFIVKSDTWKVHALQMSKPQEIS